jgi:hypothetical protein
VRVGIALTGDKNGRSHIRVDTHGENVFITLVVLGFSQARDHRPNIGTPAIGFLEHWAAHPDRVRSDLACHGSVQDRGRPVAGFPHIDMGVGPERSDDVGERA